MTTNLIIINHKSLSEFRSIQPISRGQKQLVVEHAPIKEQNCTRLPRANASTGFTGAAAKAMI